MIDVHILLTSIRALVRHKKFSTNGMSKSELEEIQDILASHNLEAFVGRSESVFFDAKSGASPYDLDTGTGRFELAKDASSLANSEGGMIVIGLVASPSGTADTEEVTSLDLVLEDDFDVPKYTGVLREYVYPAIRGLQVNWASSATERTRGVGVIQVPPQDLNSKPYLLCQLDETAKKKREIIFGIAMRAGAHTNIRTKEDLRKALHKGTDESSVRLTAIEQNLSLALDKLAAIQEQLPPIAPATQSASTPEIFKKLEARIARVLEAP